MIVLSPNPAHTLREQLQRLYRRRKRQAIWITGNLAILGIGFLALSLGPAVAAVILGNQEEWWAWALAGILGLAGFSLARRMWRPGHALLLEMTGLLVNRAVELDPEDSAGLTDMEVETLKELQQNLKDVEREMSEAVRQGRSSAFSAPRETFRNRYQELNVRLSRRNISDRLKLVDAVLSDAVRADAADVDLYAKAVFNLARETRQAVERRLNGRSVSPGAKTWPVYYSQGRQDDRAHHGGRPEYLRKLVEQCDGWLDVVEAGALPA